MSDPRNSDQRRRDGNRQSTIKRLRKCESRILTALKNGETVKNAQARLSAIRQNLYGIDF